MIPLVDNPIKWTPRELRTLQYDLSLDILLTRLLLSLSLPLPLPIPARKTAIATLGKLRDVPP